MLKVNLIAAAITKMAFMHLSSNPNLREIAIEGYNNE